MKEYLKNFAMGIPLALGAMLTLVAAVLTLRGGDDMVGGLLAGLIGIPILFASLTQVLDQD
jgi:hypothetical protein